MKKEERLVNKVKRLLKRLGCPRWLHHFGPKKYEFLHHLFALLVRSFCRLSYRRVKKFLSLLGFVCPSKSALQATNTKLDSVFWNKLLKATSGYAYLVAIDSTGLSCSNPSYHYLKRINGTMPKIPIKVSVAFNTAKKKFCAAKIHVLPRHDIKDAKILLKRSKPKVFVADKAYDATWLHDYCKENKIKAHIPLREYGKSRHKNFSSRILASKKFKKRTYHRRELIESGFGSIKQKYGSSVSSKKAKTIRNEVYSRLTIHNIISLIIRLSGQRPLFGIYL